MAAASRRSFYRIVSNQLFPIDLAAQLEVTPVARVNVDTFESGATATRRLWPAQYFKRHIRLTTVPLSDDESRTLRSFIGQRGGQYDSFWIRLNAHREGNALVRLVRDPVRTWQGGKRVYQLEMDEVAPIRSLPEYDELATAAGQSALVWYDANRERHIQTVLNGTPQVGFDNATYDTAGLINRATWYGSPTEILGGLTSQYQYYQPQAGSTPYAIAPSTTAIGTGQPAATIFAIVQAPSSASQQVIGSIGASGSGTALGLQLTAGNKWAPYVGATETWTGAATTNTPNTWISLAAVWSATSNVGTLYANAALIGTDTNTRSIGSARPINLLAGGAGGSQPFSGQLAHYIAFPVALTLAQVKAVHNLLGYQYGLATV